MHAGLPGPPVLLHACLPPASLSAARRLQPPPGRRLRMRRPSTSAHLELMMVWPFGLN